MTWCHGHGIFIATKALTGLQILGWKLQFVAFANALAETKNSFLEVES